MGLEVQYALSYKIEQFQFYMFELLEHRVNEKRNCGTAHLQCLKLHIMLASWRPSSDGPQLNNPAGSSARGIPPLDRRLVATVLVAVQNVSFLLFMQYSSFSFRCKANTHNVPWVRINLWSVSLGRQPLCTTWLLLLALVVGGYGPANINSTAVPSRPDT